MHFVCLYVAFFVLTAVVKDGISLCPPSCDSPASVCGVSDYRHKHLKTAFQILLSKTPKLGRVDPYTISLLWLWVISSLPTLPVQAGEALLTEKINYREALSQL